MNNETTTKTTKINDELFIVQAIFAGAVHKSVSVTAEGSKWHAFYKNGRGQLVVMERDSFEAAEAAAKRIVLK